MTGLVRRAVASVGSVVLAVSALTGAAAAAPTAQATPGSSMLTPGAPPVSAASDTNPTASLTVKLKAAWRVTKAQQLRLKDGTMTCTVSRLIRKNRGPATKARIRCTLPPGASTSAPSRLVVTVKGVKGARVTTTVSFPSTGTPGGGTGGGGAPPVTPPPVTPATTSAGAIARVNTDAAGNGGNADAGSATWSPDGSRVAFISAATNLVPGVVDGCPHVFVKTLATNAIAAVDRRADGVLGDCLDSLYDGLAFSPDGTWLLMCASSNSLMPTTSDPWTRLFGKNLVTGEVEWFGPECSHPVWTGNRIAFAATDAWPCDDGNGFWDVYVIERNSPLQFCSDFYRASSNSGGTGATGGSSLRPQFGPGATKVLFESESPTLVPGDTNNGGDIFVKDLGTGQASRVSTRSGGAQGSGGAQRGSWSPDGTRVMFESSANDLVPGDLNVGKDIFVKDLASGALTLVSTKADGSPAVGGGVGPALPDNYASGWAPDGRRISWMSHVVSLVPNDANQLRDVFVKDLSTGFVQLVSSSAAGVQGESNSGTFSIAPGMWSPDGTRVLLESSSQNLAPGDGNAFAEDVFVKTVS